MEHELWVDAERLVQRKAGRVVLVVAGKLLAELDEHAVEPSQDVGAVVNLGLEDGNAGHKHGGCFLVEAGGNGGVACLSIVAGEGGDSEAVEAARVLIVRDELHVAHAALRWRLASRRDDFKVGTERGLGCDGADLPRASAADTNFCLADVGTLLVCRNGVSDHTSNLQLF